MSNQAIGVILRRVRERLGMTQELVAERLKVPRSAISDMETGRRDVSALELLELSRLYGEPMEHLLGSTAHDPEEELLALRADAVDSTVRAELHRFVNRCGDYQWLEESTGEARVPDLRSPRAILSTYHQARDLAEQERKRLDLGLTPAHQLLLVLEDRVGIKVLAMPVGKKLSGASLHSERFGQAILLNSSEQPRRQVFTLAHEYFHLLTRGRVTGSKGAQPAHLCEARVLGQTRDRGEELANQFAGQLLMPVDHLVEQIRRHTDESGSLDVPSQVALAQYFGVSVQAILTRMAMLKMIPWDVAREAPADPDLRLFRTNGDDLVCQPLRFKHLAVKAYRDEQISKSRLAELLGVNVADVDQESARFGGKDSGHDVNVTLPR